MSGAIRSPSGKLQVTAEARADLEARTGRKFPTTKAEAEAIMHDDPRYLDVTSNGDDVRQMVEAYFRLAGDGVAAEMQVERGQISRNGGTI